MEEDDMNNSGSKASKIEAICYSKQCAQMERPLAFIRTCIEVKVGVYYCWNIVVLASRREKAIWENGKRFGLVEIERISSRDNDIEEKGKTNSHICSGKPWTGKWAA